MSVDLKRRGRAEVRREIGHGWEKFRASWREEGGAIVVAPSRWTSDEAWADVPEDMKQEEP